MGTYRVRRRSTKSRFRRKNSQPFIQEASADVNNNGRFTVESTDQSVLSQSPPVTTENLLKFLQDNEIMITKDNYSADADSNPNIQEGNIINEKFTEDSCIDVIVETEQEIYQAGEDEEEILASRGDEDEVQTEDFRIDSDLKEEIIMVKMTDLSSPAEVPPEHNIPSQSMGEHDAVFHSTIWDDMEDTFQEHPIIVDDNKVDILSATIEEELEKPNEGSESSLRIEETLEKELMCLKHPLEDSWSFWYSTHQSKSWEESLCLISTVGTIEDFWSVYNWISEPSELAAGADYSMFRAGVRPDWDHSANQGGGRWLLDCQGPATSLLSLPAAGSACNYLIHPLLGSAPCLPSMLMKCLLG